jgi:cytochrome c biogenesis protein CcdA
VEENLGLELRLSLRSLGAIIAGAVTVLGVSTVYKAVESNQSWLWILVQGGLIFLGLLTVIVLAQPKGVQKENSNE